MAYSGRNSVHQCVASCQRLGYNYAGVQFTSECWCGNSYGRYGRAHNCNMKCSADHSQICGGGWANNVYRVTGHRVSTPTIIRSRSRSSEIGGYESRLGSGRSRSRRFDESDTLFGRRRSRSDRSNYFESLIGGGRRQRSGRYESRARTRHHGSSRLGGFASFGNSHRSRSTRFGGYESFGSSQRSKHSRLGGYESLVGRTRHHPQASVRYESLVHRQHQHHRGSIGGGYAALVNRHRSHSVTISRHHSAISHSRPPTRAASGYEALVGIKHQHHRGNTGGGYSALVNSHRSHSTTFVRHHSAVSNPRPPTRAARGYEALVGITRPQPQQKQVVTVTRRRGDILGCFRDSPSRDLPRMAYSGRNSVHMCVAACTRLGYMYAGVQYSKECWCGNSYGKHGRAYNCNMRCSAHNGQTCGGGWANNIYVANP